MRRPYAASITMLAAALLVAMGVLVGGRATVAQDAEASPSAMDGMVARPAHIHTGTCDTLGEVVFPLNDLTVPGAAATPAAMDATTAGVAASPVAGMPAQPELWSVTVIEASLETILQAPHAINVHESAENIQTYIACGDVRGTTEQGRTDFPIYGLNDSGYEGVASLVANDDGTTTVSVWLWSTSDDLISPAATPDV